MLYFPISLLQICPPHLISYYQLNVTENMVGKKMLTTVSPELLSIDSKISQLLEVKKKRKQAETLVLSLRVRW